MPNDFSASVLENIKLILSEVFEGGRTYLDEMRPPATAETLLREQTARVNLLYEQNKCIGANVYFLTPDSTTLPPVQTTAPTPNCTLADGDTLSSNVKTMIKNIYIEQSLMVDDNLCDNEFEFADIVARNLRSSLSKICESLNNYLIQQLVANAMTPTFIPSNATLNGSIVEFPAADFVGIDAPDILAAFNQIATNNFISSNYFLLNGNNFYQSFYNSQFKQLNDNQRSGYAQFINGQRMYWDPRSLDQVVGAPTTFIVDPNMYATYFQSDYPDTMRDTYDTNNTAVFSIPLSYVINAADSQEVRTLQFANNRALADVKVDIEYQKPCLEGTGDDGLMAHRHKWRILLRGMFDIAPSTDGSSGIIEIQQS